MTYHVVFAPEATQQLRALASCLGDEADYVMGIVDFCESLATFPNRGRDRSDIRPGLRVTGHRRRVAIAYAVVQDETVVILGVFYGGQDFDARLRE